MNPGNTAQTFLDLDAQRILSNYLLLCSQGPFSSQFILPSATSFTGWDLSPSLLPIQNFNIGTLPNLTQPSKTVSQFQTKKANYIATIQNSQSEALTENNNMKIFIKGLPYHYNKSDLNNLIQKYAVPINIELPLKSDDKRVNLGYGFASFRTRQDAEKVLQSLDKHMIGKLCLNVEYFSPKAKSHQSSRVPGSNRLH